MESPALRLTEIGRLIVRGSDRQVDDRASNAVTLSPGLEGQVSSAGQLSRQHRASHVEAGLLEAEPWRHGVEARYCERVCHLMSA